jgi:hypothetical protein
MSNTSVYPRAIDGYAQLPIAIDGITNINAFSINTLRSAIYNIESELGVTPSGDHSSLSDRVSDLDSVIDDLAETVNDLETTINNLENAIVSGSYAKIAEVTVPIYLIKTNENYIFIENDFHTEVTLPAGLDHITGIITIKSGNFTEANIYTINTSLEETIDYEEFTCLDFDLSSITLVFNKEKHNWGIV